LLVISSNINIRDHVGTEIVRPAPACNLLWVGTALASTSMTNSSRSGARSWRAWRSGRFRWP